MLPKSQKLSRATFPKHTDHKKTWTGIQLRVQYTLTKDGEAAKCAVVVSKKVYASAVKRNELKRMVFRSIEEYGKSLLVRKGIKVMFFPSIKNGPIKKETIKKDIQSFISELR